MKTRILGKTNGLSVSAVGMGCMGFSHGYGAAPERDESIRLIRLAHELGCNFFDTAEGYGTGHNETLVGDALKPIRNEGVLATKLHIPTLNGKS
ncbi:MAG: aldo/keto reductase, partial [Oscillospiraceae bacterium]|nr:aldo/keto reductase [Oscillospiraceae bacterium]